MSDGLELLMNITLRNGASVPHEYLLVNISIINTASHNVTVAAVHDWPVNGLSLGSCGTLNYPVGIAIFRGYYTASNISSAGEPLELYAPGTYSCPMILSYIKNYSFPPYGTAGLGSNYVNGTIYLRSYSLSYFLNLSGYYTGNSTVLVPFQPGAYTIVGATEWGQMVILHFNGGVIDIFTIL